MIFVETMEHQKPSALKTWMVWHQQSQPEKLIALFARDKEHGRRGYADRNQRYLKIEQRDSY